MLAMRNILPPSGCIVRSPSDPVAGVTLREYFCGTFTREKLAGRTRNTTNAYASAVRSLIRHVGRELLINELTQELIVEHESASIADRRTARETARQYKFFLRAIARHADPTRCPRTYVPAIDADADMPGALLHFVKSVYLPYHPDLSRGAIEQYVNAVRCLSRHLGRPALLADLTDDTVTSYLNSMRLWNRPPATVKKARTNLLTLWRYAWRKRLVAEQPRDVPTIRLPRPNPAAWRMEDIEAILVACDRTYSVGDFDGRHWKALILTAFDTSLRIGALLNVRLVDVDLERCSLISRSENEKNNQDQVRRLHPQTVAAIRGSIDKPRELLFPWPKTNRQIWRHYGRILEDAGLPATQRDKFHKLRRTSFSLTWAKLGPAAAMLQAGHQSTEMARYYLDRSVAQEYTTCPVDVLPRPVERLKITHTLPAG